MPDCLTLTAPACFPLRTLSMAVALGLTSLLAGCSSTPASSSAHAKKPVSLPTNRGKPTSARTSRQSSGRTYATGNNSSNLQASALDDDSVDALETLLEATDMDAVEGNKLVVMRYGDLWNRMRAGFKMDLDVENNRVYAQRNWFASRQTYIDRLTARASRYLYHTVTEAERRGIPTELALLPVIESSYDPAATSNAAAAGMWQFIPSTGRLYGLRQSDLYDGRRDVVESTRAAYDFLTSLYNKFGSWELALAAYNAGPGRIQQAINANAARGLPTDYWSLRLPTETMNYVPRFLAVAQIVREPSRSNLILPAIANRPHFRSVTLSGPIDLGLAGQVIGLSAKELYELNPAFRRGQTDPAGPHRLLIPNALPVQVDERLAQLPLLAGGYMVGAEPQGGAVILSQSRGYSNAQVAALMGDSAVRSSSANLSAQITTRINPVPAMSRVALPTSSAALAALANQASLPSGPARLSMPSATVASTRTLLTPATTVAVTTRPVNPVSRPVAPVVAVTPVAVTPPVGEQPLSVAERQRLMAEGLAAIHTTPAAETLAATATLSASTTVRIAPVAPIETSIVPALVGPTGNTEPALSAAEKAQVVAEIQQVAPIGTAVIDPLDGKIQLSAIQTQQTVLSANGQDRHMSYEKPYLNPIPAVTANIINARATRPIAMLMPTADIAKPPRPKGERTVYTVQAGDSLTAVATRYGVDVDDVANWNQMARNANLMTGTPLYLYGVKTPTKPTSYVVQAGDTLSGLATRFGLSNQQLADYNDLSPSANLFAGRKLSLLDTPTSKAASRVRKPVTDSYMVKAGESLKLLAVRYGLTVDELAALNDLPADQKLQRGQSLRVPASLIDDSILDAKSTDKSTDKGRDKSANKSNSRKPATEDYTVKGGESLIVLATRYGLTADEFGKLNDMASDRLLQRGQRVQVPVVSHADDDDKTDARASKSKSNGPTLSYSVKAGDTLIGVANRYEVDPAELARLNDLTSSALLQRGQTIQVPDKGPKLIEYTVRSGDTLQRVAKKHGITLAQLAELNDIPTAVKLYEGDTINVPSDSKGGSH
jgi:LysM repeat protein/soluble lytic murein transglycosylase-like protein